MNPFPREGQYLTESGELVRSKSEKILADLFNRHGIPYVYEPEFELDNGYYIYPDFALLNVKERRTIYWEHFGKVNDEDYVMWNIQKVTNYIQHDIVPWDNLIMTYNNKKGGFDARIIDAMIEAWLL